MPSVEQGAIIAIPAPVMMPLLPSPGYWSIIPTFIYCSPVPSLDLPGTPRETLMSAMRIWCHAATISLVPFFLVPLLPLDGEKVWCHYCHLTNGDVYNALLLPPCTPPHPLPKKMPLLPSSEGVIDAIIAIYEVRCHYCHRWV